MAVVALFGCVPGVLELVDHFRFLDESPGVSRWAFIVLFVAMVQLAYAVYVVQLPDWGSVWVVALVSLAVAAGYAMCLGVVLTSSTDNEMLQVTHLVDADRGKTVRWCFMMLSLNSVLTYFAGRLSVRWHRTFRLLTDSPT